MEKVGIYKNNPIEYSTTSELRTLMNYKRMGNPIMKSLDEVNSNSNFKTHLNNYAFKRNRHKNTTKEI